MANGQNDREKDNTEYQTKESLIYARLRREILLCTIRPGQRLQQNQLARQYGSSLIPLREALKRLHSEGLVEIRPHSGVVVSTVDLGLFAEILEILLSLSGLVARSACAHFSAEDHKRAATALESMRSAANREDGIEWATFDREFHEILYGACHMPLLERVLQIVIDRQEQARRAFIMNVDFFTLRSQGALSEHEEILEAIRLGDVRRAEEALRLHQLNVMAAARQFYTAADESPAEQSRRYPNNGTVD